MGVHLESSQVSHEPLRECTGLRCLMREHPLFFFFFLAYAFSWIVSLPYVLSIWGILPGNYMTGFMLKQWAGPTLAAATMTRVLEGKPGSARLRSRIRQWRAGWHWYLFILLGIPLLILLGVMLLPGTFAGFRGLSARLLVTYPAYFVVVFVGVGLPEEIGWRGFALPRMQQRYGPLGGTLLLGVLWAFWHLLYFFTPDHGGGPGVASTTLIKNFALFFMLVMAMSIIFTWVFNKTKGSILVASIMHTAIDAPQVVWVPAFLNVGQSNSTAGEAGLDLASLITFGVLALLILLLTRGRLGYPPVEGQRLGVGSDRSQRTL